MRDQDTIRRFDLLELSADDYWIVLKNGCVIAVLAYILAAMLAEATGIESWALVSAPPLLGVLYSLWMIWAANRRLTPTQRARLTKQRNLIRRRQRMQVVSDDATADREDALAMMERLRDLVTRMERIHPDKGVLADQIAGLEKVFGVLDDRTHADWYLIDRYDRESQLLGIEIDALDVVPGDAEAALAARLAELEALEEEIKEGERSRSAELELERFLGEVAA
jgi:hypothetical protein